MKTLKVRILEHTGCFLESFNNKYYNMPKQQLIHIFFPSNYNYTIVSQHENADICVFSIQLDDISLLRTTEVNFMICIENCTKWTHYIHYNKYHDYGNDLIDIYAYNHISSIYRPENSKFIAIPTVYMRINYFKLINNYFNNFSLFNYSFNAKKFCLMTNKSNLNPDIRKLVEQLKKYGNVEHISQYDQQILNASCYNSLELLQIYNQYKFIICFENSYNDGYITEKIFNCFLAKSIPIYSGSPIVEKFLNTESFINIQYDSDLSIDKSMKLLENLINNETLYNEIINKNKISSSYDDEDYMKKMVNFIDNKLNNKLLDGVKPH